MHPIQKELYHAAKRVCDDQSEEALGVLRMAVGAIDEFDPVELMSDKEIIGAIDEKGVDLTDWEIEFIESITTSLENYPNLTDKQRAVVVRIYRKKVPDGD
jgi:hypothetical protein